MVLGGQAGRQIEGDAVLSRLDDLRVRLDDLERATIRKTPSYGSIYVYGNSSAQSIATGASYTKSTAFDTDGDYEGCIPDANSAQMGLERGDYLVIVTLSVKAATPFINLTGAVHLTQAGGSATEQQQIVFVEYIEGANVEETIAAAGFVRVDNDEGATLDLRIKHDSGGAANVTITHGSLSAYRV